MHISVQDAGALGLLRTNCPIPVELNDKLAQGLFLSDEERRLLVEGPIVPHCCCQPELLPPDFPAVLEREVAAMVELELRERRYQRWESGRHGSGVSSAELHREAAILEAAVREGAWTYGVPDLERLFFRLKGGVPNESREYRYYADLALEVRAWVVRQAAARIANLEAAQAVLPSPRASSREEAEPTSDEVPLIAPSRTLEGAGTLPAASHNGASIEPQCDAYAERNEQRGEATGDGPTTEAPSSEEAATEPAIASWPSATRPASGRLSDLLAHFERREARGLASDTVRGIGTAVKAFIELNGNVFAADIDKAMARTYRDCISDLPALNGKGIYAGLKKPEAVERLREVEASVESGATIDEIAATYGVKNPQADEDAITKGMACKAVNKYLYGMRRIMRHAENWGFAPQGATPFENLNYSNKAIANERQKRTEWAQENMRLWFKHILQPERLEQRGLKSTPAYLLATVSSLCAALRLEEFAQTKVSDLEERDGHIVWCIRDGDGQRLKSDSAERDIPLNDYLLRCGLMRLVEHRRARGDTWLFPECQPGGPARRRGYTLSKRFSEDRRAAGFEDKSKNHHALRNTINTVLQRKQVPDSMRRYLLGHRDPCIASTDYFGGYRPEDLLQALAKIDYLDALPPPEDLDAVIAELLDREPDPRR